MKQKINVAFLGLSDKRIEGISQERNVGYIIDAAQLQLLMSGSLKWGYSSRRCNSIQKVNKWTIWIQVRTGISHF